MNEFKLTRRAADPEKQALFDECIARIEAYGTECYLYAISARDGTTRDLNDASKRSADALTKIKQVLFKISQQSPGEWKVKE